MPPIIVPIIPTGLNIIKSTNIAVIEGLVLTMVFFSLANIFKFGESIKIIIKILLKFYSFYNFLKFLVVPTGFEPVFLA